MTEHNTISDPNLHEPKGASSATDKQVYVSDGAGSGTWVTWPFGWGFYEHSLSGQVIDTTASLIHINGLGTQTNETQLPQGASSLWSIGSNKLLPISEGDAYEIRLSLPIASKTGSPGTLTLETDIGGTATPTIIISTRDLNIGATAPFDVQLAFPVFIGSTAETNGIQFFFKTSAGSVTLGTGAEILITRLYGAI